MNLKSTVFILLLWVISTQVITAQSCLLDGIQFSTQAEIDSFPANYPGCTTILGDVTISGGDITNLDSLSDIIAIDGSLLISSNTNLVSLMGLSALANIGEDLTIEFHDSLTSLMGLSALITIGDDVFIGGNNGLGNLEGFDALQSIGGNLIIQDNDALTSLDGLDSLLTIGGVFGIQADSALTSLAGLSALTAIGGSLTIEANPALASLSSLPALKSISQDLYISNNSVLMSLSGLDSLIAIKGTLTIGNNDSLIDITGLNSLTQLIGDLEIYGNASLISLSGLDSLATVGEFLRVYENPKLTNLTGIQHINLVNLKELFLYFNEVLTFCSTPNICHYLDDPLNPAYIADNDPGCNNRPEVEAACLLPCNLVLDVKASQNAICVGASSTLSASVTGGLPPYSFEWSNGIFTPQQVVSPIITTTYSVTVTDDQGCTAEGTITIIVNPLPQAVATNNSPLCQGATILLSASGGISFFWTGPNNFSSFSSNPSILNAQSVHAGVYTVVVTDNNGCSNTATTTVIVNPPPVVFAGSNSPVCLGNTILLNASGGASYKWTGPQAFNSIQQNPTIPDAKLNNGGVYHVTVTASTGCTAKSTTTVTVVSNPTAFATNDSPKCPGETIKLNASGGIFYNWSGPNGFQSSEKSPVLLNVMHSQAGTYSVTVTAANGCTAVKTTIVQVKNGPNAFADNTGPGCTGQDVDLYASGGIDYYWTGPNGFYTNAQNPTLFDLQLADAGTYTVLITDNEGCTAAVSTVLIVNGVFATTSVTHESCGGCNNGSASVSPSGANSYTYLWSNGKTTQAISGLSPGIYTVTVTGNNGCSTTAVAAVNSFSCPPIIITPTIVHPVCHGQNGMASVLVSGGNPPFTYLWSNNVMTNSITAPAGIYTVVVTDNNNCAESIQVTITSPPKLIASVSTIAVTCEGMCNGVASASATGGVPPYIWVWSTGSNQSTVSNLCPGQYTVSVFDANVCNDSQTGITIGPGISAKPVIEGDTKICDGLTGTLYVQPGFDSYIWNTGSFSSSINWVLPGTYSVTVTKSICSGSASLSTMVHPELNITLSFIGDTLFALVSGGSPPYNYLWSTGTMGSFIIPSSSGIYTVTVFDQQDCNVLESIEVNINAILNHSTLPLKIHPNPVYDLLHVDLPDGPGQMRMEIYTNAGFCIRQQEWTAGQSMLEVSNLLPGTYFLVLHQSGKKYVAVFVKQ